MNKFIPIWQQILAGSEHPWVLFRNGTCVLLTEGTDTPGADAVCLLMQWGPAKAGTPSNSHTVTVLSKDPGGCIVSCHHPGILVHVSRDEVINLGMQNGFASQVGLL